MTPPPKEPQPRISENDRDTAVRRLQEAYAEGHISHEEMDAHLQRILTAETPGDIESALGSLPAEDPGTTSTITAATGRIRRGGAWRVPRHLKVHSALGRVSLDLSQAVFEHPVLDIELQLGTGGARITVPRDAVVDLEGLSSTWKDTLYKAGRGARPGGGPTIRITGTMGMGRLKVRHARR
ncbi:DUF1707 domain-containing protein [Streptomyces sp. RK9]|uniref:DUF1707 SHOCT-like domain-containing protein n=1 Tax=Streptomyces sp. RK9 TaxID=3239284 RepID=UPI003868C0D8